MTKIKFLAVLLFTAIFASCSSGDDNNDNNDNQPTIGSFEFVYNNETKKVSSWVKIDDFIEVSGETADGIGIDFKFNVYGNLYEAFTHGTSATSSVPMHEASQVLTSNTFTFTIVELNSANKMVKVNFSGKLYDNPYDVEANYITNPSDFIPVSGSFNVAYEDLVPSIPGLGTFAKFDGIDWHGMSLDSSTDGLTETTTLNVENDGKYSLGIVFPKGNLKTGTFAFTSNDFSNRISFKKFDIATYEFIDYNVSGTITYTTVNNIYAEGTFSLTAENPIDDSKIVITEGKFKEGR
jgi:hypothetical protein